MHEGVEKFGIFIAALRGILADPENVKIELPYNSAIQLLFI